MTFELVDIFTFQFTNFIMFCILKLFLKTNKSTPIIRLNTKLYKLLNHQFLTQISEMNDKAFSIFLETIKKTQKYFHCCSDSVETSCIKELRKVY